MSNSDYNNAAAGWAAEAGEEKLTPRRARWSTGLFDCFGRNDKFSTSDRQVYYLQRNCCTSAIRSQGLLRETLACRKTNDMTPKKDHASKLWPKSDNQLSLLFADKIEGVKMHEARELHRRLPDPGFNSQPLLVTIPPGQQTMGRDGA
ncbi:hypothetical protein RHMOL_Rhmol05G0247600 [Rhododendron molle]|uniref:Uncharacterized protein n=1 Tax=Rhododendron molle TaxID=49168 RepID=A0ACC0NSN5_RHOML|nr:hypothetical protein RHMOL_Rhmol05G0247600 [Rhododendron molle]